MINNLHYVDIIIVVGFLFCLIAYGFYLSSKNKNLNDFLLAGKNIPWYVAMFSIVATETSVLTFLSVPGFSYRGDWSFLQLSLGYIIGRFLVSYLLIPLYFKYGVVSIYEILEKKFNKTIQKIASITFLITRVFADAVRFAGIAIIIKVITSWSILSIVFIMAFVTLIYTVLGGLKAVVKVDSIQFIIYFISAIFCIACLLRYHDLNLFSSLALLSENNKLQIFDFSGKFFFKPYMFFASIIGGAMLSFASHGADYMMVQRVLATKDVKSAQKAMIYSGFFVFLQFALFLLVGSLIYLINDPYLIDKNKEVGKVILNILPVGVKGFVLVGILSVAMSTLSSSINSLTSSTMKDLFVKSNSLIFSRFVSLFWAVVLTLVALKFTNQDDYFINVGFKIASFTYGSLLSFFILSKFNTKFQNTNVILGYISGILSCFYFMKFGIAWTFYILGSISVNLLVVFLLERSRKILVMRDIVICSIIVFSSVLIFASTSKVYTKIINFDVKDTFKENKVWTGAELLTQYKQRYDNVLFEDYQKYFINDQGKPINAGIVINQTSNLHHIDESSKTINVNLGDIKVKAVFTPEHGLKSSHQAGVSVNGDSTYNIPIISLYGDKRKPSVDDLYGLDAIFFDIQDIGSRYYTYISTMTYVMEACAENNIKLFILDRPNPISGLTEGPILNNDYSSFVGMHPIPIRHGMTIGELAYMINDSGWLKNNLKVDLYILKMQGWNREMYYDETGLDFIPPSPNILDFETALMYSGTCLIEGTNLSEGRGTNMPFMKIGSPWLNSKKLVETLNNKNFSSVKFHSVKFRPKTNSKINNDPKYLDEIYNGFKIDILDVKSVEPIKIAITILDEIYKLHPDKFKFLSTNFIDKLYGSSDLRNQILKGKDLMSLFNSWENSNGEFQKYKNKFLIY